MSRDTSVEGEAGEHPRVRMARLEADMAYFQARLELIRIPGSTNQLAQRKVFNLLHKVLAGQLAECEGQSLKRPPAASDRS